MILLYRHKYTGFSSHQCPHPDYVPRLQLQIQPLSSQFQPPFGGRTRAYSKRGLLINPGSDPRQAAFSAPKCGRCGEWHSLSWFSLFFSFFIRSMTFEGAGQHKLAEFTAHHIFLNIDGNVLTALMYRNGETDKIWKKRLPARTRFYVSFIILCGRCFDFFQQMEIAKRTLFNRTRHSLSLPVFLNVFYCGVAQSSPLCICCGVYDNLWSVSPKG